MPPLAEQAADPGRMRPGLQRDPASRHRPEDLLQAFRSRAESQLHLDAPRFIQYAVLTVAISQIQSDRPSLLRKIPALLRQGRRKKSVAAQFE